MAACILVGSILTIITVGIHSFGTAWWIGQLKQPRSKPMTAFAARVFPIKLLCSTALVLLALHIAEVGPWALLYMNLPGNDSLNNFEASCYFATVTFASLGYGDIVIDGPWRMLSAIQAMNGLLVFGWSTALLFAVVERIWGHDQSPRASTESAPEMSRQFDIPENRPASNRAA